jgi:hypothetical protein
MKTQGTYTVGEPFSYELTIEYDYYWDDGDHQEPPEDGLEISKVYLNGNDITTFYIDFLEDSIGEQLHEYAQNNKNN